VAAEVGRLPHFPAGDLHLIRTLVRKGIGPIEEMMAHARRGATSIARGTPFGPRLTNRQQRGFSPEAVACKQLDVIDGLRENVPPLCGILTGIEVDLPRTAA